jgi:hypothetical protein
MPRSRAVLVIAAVLALAAPAAASAETVRFTGTAKVRAIEGSTLAGTTTGTLGRGAVVYRTSPGPNNTIISTFTIFQEAGTLRGVATVTQTPGQNGAPTTLSGTANIRSGTGRWRGARGRFTVAGTTAADGLITIRATNGRFRY